ncbi:MAG: zinc-finger domain-containing protein [Pseudomonadota bacterium]|jgi:uncharacterized Zn-finger protein
MSEPIRTEDKAETTVTGALRVACGGPMWGRHPKVYLTMVDDEQGKPNHVVCPYCSHVFIYDSQRANSAAHP